MITLAIILTACSGRYGYHRDELYFRLLRPAWGYVDQPPLTPFLARMFGHLADQPWAMRVPATLATVLSVYVLVLVTREFGGARRAQALCAWGYALASLPLILGHEMLTATIDLPVWPAILLFIARAQLRQQPRWWLAAGLVVGVSMYNKLLVAILLVAIAAGFAMVGPRSVLRSAWVWTALFVALVVGLPNLIYQATHSWPQFSMGAALADNNAGDVRVMMWPMLFLILGPPQVCIWIAGFVSLLRRPEWRPVRFLAASFPVLLILVFLMGTQIYYPFGLLAVLFAVGCVPAATWTQRRRTNIGVTAVGVAVNAMVSVLLGLPVIPLSALGRTPVPAVNQAARDTVGWPAYVTQIAQAYAGLSTAEKAQAVVVASNYGEAGAVDRYGARYGLPTVYSGHNALYYQARPPESATVVIMVGGQFDAVRNRFESCDVIDHLDNGVDVDNEEQGEPVAVCRNPIGGWATVWPTLRHED